MRRIPAKEAGEDVRAGMSDADLMTKYTLTERGLQGLLQKLFDAGVLSRAELANRAADLAGAPSSSWKCPACGTPQTHEFDECPRCGIVVAKLKGPELGTGANIEPPRSQIREEAKEPAVPTPIVPKRFSIHMPAVLGAIGCLFLVAGVFLPVIKLPFLGGVTLIQIGKVTGGVAGFAYFVLAITVISVLLILFKYYRWLWLTSLGSAAVLLFTFLQFRRGLYHAKTWIGSIVSMKPASQFFENPQLSFLKDQMQQMLTIETDWGWAILFIGSALLAVAALIATIRPPLFKPEDSGSKSGAAA